MDEIIKQNNNNNKLLTNIREILLSARHTAYKAVNFAMVTAYWNIGKLIVEDEQNGNARAEYGKAVFGGTFHQTDKGVWKGIYHNQPQKHAAVLFAISKRSHTAWRIDLVTLSPANQGKKRPSTPVVYERGGRAGVVFAAIG